LSILVEVALVHLRVAANAQNITLDIKRQVIRAYRTAKTRDRGYANNGRLPKVANQRPVWQKLCGSFDLFGQTALKQARTKDKAGRRSRRRGRVSITTMERLPKSN